CLTDCTGGGTPTNTVVVATPTNTVVVATPTNTGGAVASPTRTATGGGVNPTATPTRTNTPGGVPIGTPFTDEDGCQIGSHNGGSLLWLLIPAIGLLVIRRRQR